MIDLSALAMYLEVLIMMRFNGMKTNPLLFYLEILLCIILMTSCKQGQSKSTLEAEAKKPPISQSMEQSSDKMKIIQPRTTAAWPLGPAIEKKLDPALKKKITELLAADRSDEPVQMIGKYAQVEAYKLKQILSELGCSVGTVTTSFFTVECPAGAVLDLAGLEFIEYLELSKERYLFY